MFRILFAFIVLLYFGIGRAEEKYYGGFLCGYPEFKCVQVKTGDTWTKLFPNEKQREMVKRLNRINMPLHYRDWIVVPINLKTLNYMNLSPFPDTISQNGKKVIVVNLSLQAFAAYDESGNQVHWGPVSAGRGWCKDINHPCVTEVGEFDIFRKQGPECVSSAFPVETDGGAPMPYCMHYFNGFAIHGSTLPGYHDSHGCIRVFYDDAEWLNTQFASIGTKVIVTR